MSYSYFRLRIAKLPIAVVALLVCFFVIRQSNARGQTLESHYIAMEEPDRVVEEIRKMGDRA